MLAPEVDADAVADELVEGAEGRRAVPEVEVPAPPLDHAIDLRDDVGRWPPGAIATRERLHRVP